MTIDPIIALTAHCILSCSNRLNLEETVSLLRFYRDKDYQLACEFLVVYLREGSAAVHEQEACDLERLWRYWAQLDPQLHMPCPPLTRCTRPECKQCRRRPA